MLIRECINNLTHSLLQQGLEMRQRGVGAPPSATKNLDSTTSGEGRSIRKDSNRQPFESPPAGNGRGGIHAGTPRSSPSVDSRTVYKQQATFKKRLKVLPDRVHQPMPCLVRGKDPDKSGSGIRCMYKKCRGLELKSKRRVSYKTIYQCEQCTADRGSPLWLCHTTKRINGEHTVVSCHLRYHSEKKFMVGGSGECSVISSLSEE